MGDFNTMLSKSASVVGEAMRNSFVVMERGNFNYNIMSVVIVRALCQADPKIRSGKVRKWCLSVLSQIIRHTGASGNCFHIQVVGEAMPCQHFAGVGYHCAVIRA